MTIPNNLEGWGGLTLSLTAAVMAAYLAGSFIGKELVRQVDRDSTIAVLEMPR